MLCLFFFFAGCCIDDSVERRCCLTQHTKTNGESFCRFGLLACPQPRAFELVCCAVYRCCVCCCMLRECMRVVCACMCFSRMLVRRTADRDRFWNCNHLKRLEHGKYSVAYWTVSGQLNFVGPPKNPLALLQVQIDQNLQKVFGTKIIYSIYKKKSTNIIVHSNALSCRMLQYVTPKICSILSSIWLFQFHVQLGTPQMAVADEHQHCQIVHYV